MFKCECGAIFEEPKKYMEDTGEIFFICPNCNETDFNEAKQCECCEEYFLEDEIYDVCNDCLEELYTDELGLKFIDKNREFYLYHYGVEKVDDDLRDGLIEILKMDFQNKIDLEKIKEYVLDDLYDWNEFLKEEGEL